MAPPPPANDNLSLAAFITGLLSPGPVALVLGILGLNRARKHGQDNPWMAITGIVLGAVTTVAWIVMGAVLVAALWSFAAHGVETRDCARGSDSCSQDWQDWWHERPRSDRGTESDSPGR